MLKFIQVGVESLTHKSCSSPGQVRDEPKDREPKLQARKGSGNDESTLALKLMGILIRGPKQDVREEIGIDPTYILTLLCKLHPSSHSSHFTGVWILNPDFYL